MGINSQFLSSVIEIVQGAEAPLMQYFGVTSDIKAKGNASSDIVTKLDTETENYLHQNLSKLDPSIGFYGEEFGVRNHADKMWLVDPIDGTAHFVRGIPFCSTMVALIDNGTVVLSVINLFAQKKLFSALKDQGAHCNNRPISVSNRTLEQAYFSIEANLKDYPNNFTNYYKIKETSGIITTICSGFEFTLVAEGKIEGRIGLNPYGNDWDYAPGSLLVKEAGGVVSNIGLHSYDYTNHNFIASNAIVYKQLTEGDDPIFPIKL